MTHRPSPRVRAHREIGAALLCWQLAGCAVLSPPPVVTVTGNDLEPGELVVVINDNAVGGTHAGLFAGGLLSDPAGSYVATRSQSPDWRGPSLGDYLIFQREDGDRVRAYRFRVGKDDLATVQQRMRNQGSNVPLFCGAAVQNHIAGIGPFAAIETVWWASPSSLARQLDALIAARQLAGRCEGPSGAPC